MSTIGKLVSSVFYFYAGVMLEKHYQISAKLPDPQLVAEKLKEEYDKITAEKGKDK